MGTGMKAGGHMKKTVPKTKTENSYVRLLVNLYKSLALRTDFKFTEIQVKQIKAFDL